MDEIDHEGTDFPVCPHCGYRHEEWYPEIAEDDDLVSDCENCGGLLRLTRSVSITYTSEATTKEEADAEEARREALYEEARQFTRNVIAKHERQKKLHEERMAELEMASEVRRQEAIIAVNRPGTP